MKRVITAVVALAATLASLSLVGWFLQRDEQTHGFLQCMTGCEYASMQLHGTPPDMTCTHFCQWQNKIPWETEYIKFPERESQ
jgi:hypothetical protein